MPKLLEQIKTVRICIVIISFCLVPGGHAAYESFMVIFIHDSSSGETDGRTSAIMHPCEDEKPVIYVSGRIHKKHFWSDDITPLSKISSSLVGKPSFQQIDSGLYELDTLRIQVALKGDSKGTGFTSNGRYIVVCWPFDIHKKHTKYQKPEGSWLTSLESYFQVNQQAGSFEDLEFVHGFQLSGYHKLRQADRYHTGFLPAAQLWLSPQAILASIGNANLIQKYLKPSDIGDGETWTDYSDSVSSSGENILSIATLYNEFEAINAILNQCPADKKSTLCSSINKESGQTVFHLAARYRNPSVFKLLYNKCSTWSIEPWSVMVDFEGWSPLHIAARYNVLDMVTFICKKLREKDLLEQELERRQLWYTPLSMSIKSPHKTTVMPYLRSVGGRESLYRLVSEPWMALCPAYHKNRQKLKPVYVEEGEEATSDSSEELTMLLSSGLKLTDKPN